MSDKNKSIIEFILAFTAFCTILLIIRFTGLDLIVSDKAFDLTGFNSTKLLGAAAWIGKYMSVIVCSIALISLPWLLKKKKPLAREAMLAICLLGIGPGLLNNFIFKPFFQRSRPVEINRYNPENQLKFSPPLSIGKDKNGTSFPSGHSGAAFFFIFPWFCLRFRSKYGIRLIIPGLVFGIMTGAVRVLEGRHFLSDVIASLCIVYLSATVLSFFFYRNFVSCEEDISGQTAEKP